MPIPIGSETKEEKHLLLKIYDIQSNRILTQTTQDGTAKPDEDSRTETSIRHHESGIYRTQNAKSA